VLKPVRFPAEVGVKLSPLAPLVRSNASTCPRHVGRWTDAEDAANIID